MSGGVDSSVAALRLREAGHEVVGVFMKNGVTQKGDAAAEKSCCSASDARDAAVVAERLGVSFFAVDYAAEFGRIIDFFADEYRRGRTPNPCVLCNSQLKFGHLLELADDVGAECVATGHYARAVDGRLLRAVDRRKDQSYYLFGIERAALARALFPLGDSTKAEVRAQARAAGLRTAEKPESMEICFVTSGDYRDVVRARGGLGRPGRFVDDQGADLGPHDGVGQFTIGQRRGLPALGAPRYVQAIDAAAGTVVLAEAVALDRPQARLEAVHWLVEPDAPRLQAEVQIRARHEAVPAVVVPDVADPRRVVIEFAAPVRAVTPGQAAVIYRGDLVLGGGWIVG